MIDLIYAENFPLKEAVSAAKKLGIKRLILAKHFSPEKELTGLKKEASAIKFPFSFCHLAENPKEVNSFKGKADFLAIVGGDVSSNKFAVSNKQVDFLLEPVSPGRLTVDTGLCRTAKDNSKPLAFTLSRYLNASRGERVGLFRNGFFSVKLLKKFRVNALFFSGAGKKEEMRSAEELKAFARLLGFSEKQGERFIESFGEGFLGEKLYARA